MGCDNDAISNTRGSEQCKKCRKKFPAVYKLRSNKEPEGFSSQVVPDITSVHKCICLTLIPLRSVANLSSNSCHSCSVASPKSRRKIIAKCPPQAHSNKETTPD